jgi:thiosulfate reductase cytochrome b subunit
MATWLSVVRSRNEAWADFPMAGRPRAVLPSFPTPVTDSAAVSDLAVEGAPAPDSPRHALFVRVTHWLSTAAFTVLLLSGIAILLAHPRLYWGETGAVGGPSLIDLPLPFVLDVPIRGPGRYLHFLAAWVCVFTGLVYVLTGLATGHFAQSFLPPRGGLSVRAIRDVVGGHLRARRGGEDVPTTYNVLQRLTYAAVVFVLLPLMICTGLAMSPAVTSVVPAVVTAFGGQQSARTIHFFVACALTLFVLLHIVLVWQSGFRAQMRAMILGRRSRAGAPRREAA